MKAMIFAAGRGERMRPLTDTCPKPLLKVRGRPLIEWHVLNLVRAGITDIVINHAHLGHMIEEYLGDGSRFGAAIRYSAEKEALETAGGIANARHLLGEEPFLAVSGDIYCPHFDFADVTGVLHEEDMWGNAYSKEERDIAWIWLVSNRWFSPKGDFGLNLYTITNDGEPKWTYGNIGVFRPEMFDAIRPGQHYGLGKLLREFADRGRVGGEIYEGDWENVGTVQQLEALNAPAVHTGARSA